MSKELQTYLSSLAFECTSKIRQGKKGRVSNREQGQIFHIQLCEKQKFLLKSPMSQVLSVKPLYEQYISTLLAGAVEASEFQPSDHWIEST